MSNDVTKSTATASNSKHANKGKIFFRINSILSFDYGFVRFLLIGRLGVGLVAVGTVVVAAAGVAFR